MKTVLQIFFFLAIPCCLIAQNSKIGLLLNTTGGFDVVPKNKSSLSGIDDLVYFKTNNSFIKFFSASVFYNEKLGIEVSYQENYNSNSNYNAFKSMIESQYSSSDYYINYDITYNNPNHEGYFSSNSWLSGITYKFQFKRIHFAPKLLLGVMSFGAADATAYMKKKNSNEYITKEYILDKSFYSNLNINAGVNIFYLIYKRLGLNVEINYYQSKVNPKAVNYTVITSNQITGSTDITHIGSHKTLRQFSLGFGLCYYMKLGKPGA